MTSHMSRRGVLSGAAAASLLAAPALNTTLVSTAHAATSTDYANFRARWKQMLTGNGVITPSAAPYSAIIAAMATEALAFQSTMTRSGGSEIGQLWPSSEVGSYGPDAIRITALRLRKMAQASATTGGPLTTSQRTALRTDVLFGLNWLADYRYTVETDSESGWWQYEIGIPQEFLDTIILLDLPKTDPLVVQLGAAIASFSPNPSREQVDKISYPSGRYTSRGANRCWKCNVIILLGMVIEDEAKVTLGKNSIVQEWGYVGVGNDGFFADGSMLQHGYYAYAGGYGLDVIIKSANLIYGLKDIPAFAFTYASWANMRQWVYKSYEPLMYEGAMIDMSRERTLSRWWCTDHFAGNCVTYGVVRLANSATGQEKTDFEQMVKRWVVNDTARNFFAYDANTPNYQLTPDVAFRAKTIVDNAAIALRPQLNANIQYQRQDRIVHRRPSFAFGIAMHSARTRTYEDLGGGENFKGWSQTAGAVYFYNNNLSHYQDQYWPTVDPYRLPGTTIDVRTRPNSSLANTAGLAMVGGASVAQSGAACMDFSRDGGQLVAKKSWFMFGDYIACVGSGITGTGGYGVETIVENRNIGAGGTNTVTALNTSSQQVTVMETIGTTQTLTGYDWVHIDGVGGYVFPFGNPTIKGLRQSRSGTWTAINNRQINPPTGLTRRYLTLWIDHGTNPTNGTYGYVFLPNATASTTASYNAGTVNIATATAAVHYVTAAFSTVSMIGATFWNNASTSAGILSCNGQASVFLRIAGGTIEIAISDPTQTRTTNLVLTVAIANSGVNSVDAAGGISVARTATSATVTLSPSGLKGATRRVFLNA